MADQGSEGLLSPFLRKQRRKAAAPYLKGRVLDVGCGSGHLAGLVSPGNYLGVDPDEEALIQARKSYPDHVFQSVLPSAEPVFNSIAALAVLEHSPEPLRFLFELKSRLSHEPESRIIITTPHPRLELVHTAGARIGLFSLMASQEHQSLVNLKTMNLLAAQCGMEIVRYRRFLLGANQLIILKSS